MFVYIMINKNKKSFINQFEKQINDIIIKVEQYYKELYMQKKLYIVMKFVKENIMNNIFKKWNISLLIVGIVVGIGFLNSNGKSKLDNSTSLLLFILTLASSFSTLIFPLLFKNPIPTTIHTITNDIFHFFKILFIIFSLTNFITIYIFLHI